MKITITENEKITLELSKYELCLFYKSENKTISEEYLYDISEVIDDERETFIISEEDLDENENEFIMWSDSFYELIREFIGDGKNYELNTEFIMEKEIYKNHILRRFHSTNFFSNEYTPWEIWISDEVRLGVIFDNIEDAKDYINKL